jgi:hypothetical protein
MYLPVIQGLHQYQPFVPLPATTAISLDHLIGGGVKQITTAPTHLESTTLVLGYDGYVSDNPDI